MAHLGPHFLSHGYGIVISASIYALGFIFLLSLSLVVFSWHIFMTFQGILLDILNQHLGEKCTATYLKKIRDFENKKTGS